MRFEVRVKERQIEQEPRKKAKTWGQTVRQSEATRSRTAASTNIVARGQGNQAGSVTQLMGNIEGSRAPYCQTCGYSHYGRCERPRVCFRCGQPSHMKRDCPLNVFRLMYGATAPSSVVSPAHITRSVAQPMGRGISNRGAQSGIRGQTVEGRGQARAFVLNPRDAQASNAVVTSTLTICSRQTEIGRASCRERV